MSKPPPEAPVGVDLLWSYKRRLDSIPPRRRECFALVCQGLTNEQIAERMGVTVKTIEFHRQAVIQAMKASNMIHAAVMATKAGLV